MTQENYSIKKYLPYIIGTITGAALIKAGVIIGYKLHKKNLEETAREADNLASEMVQNGIGS